MYPGQTYIAAIVEEVGGRGGILFPQYVIGLETYYLFLKMIATKDDTLVCWLKRDRIVRSMNQ